MIAPQHNLNVMGGCREPILSGDTDCLQSATILITSSYIKHLSPSTHLFFFLVNFCSDPSPSVPSVADCCNTLNKFPPRPTKRLTSHECCLLHPIHRLWGDFRARGVTSVKKSVLGPSLRASTSLPLLCSGARNLCGRLRPAPPAF